MNITISPGHIHGRVWAPTSKYIAHRVLLMASLAHGTSVIRNIPTGDDATATINACRKFGAHIIRKKNQLIIQGTAGRIGTVSQRVRTIHCGESGSTLRFVTALSAATQSPLIINGGKRLRERPITGLVKALRSIELDIVSHAVGARHALPLLIKPSRIIKSTVSISGLESSQYISGLLMLAPLLPKGLTIHVRGNLVSKPYIDLTWNLLKQFGIRGTRRGYHLFKITGNQRYKAQSYTIEGDFASASYLLAGSVIAGSSLTVSNLPRNSMQPEKHIIPILKSMGAPVTVFANRVTIKKKRHLKGATLDMSTSPDLVPTVATMAVFAGGTTKLTNIDFLKYKESDRLKDTARVFRAIGVNITAGSSWLVIKGKTPTGGTTDCARDHRLAMSLAIAALGCENPVTITGAEAVNKSWPDFFQVLKKLGAHVSSP